MAKYNREFLVPYLEDVYTLYMADMTVAVKMFETQKKILQLKVGKELEQPQMPEMEDGWDFFSILAGGAGLFLLSSIPILLISILTGGLKGNQIGLAIVLMIFCAPIGLFLWWAFGVPASAASKRNAEREAQYRESLRRYRIQKQNISVLNEENRKQIPGLERTLDALSSEHKRIEGVLEKVYAANVIPRYYRNMYASAYLYDFFSTSGSDDLDMALNTYVLEQIKEKLDIMIDNQRESILNQRMILINQKAALEEQRAHNVYMREKARQIAANLEEQNQYLAMVESNTAVTAYLTTADYLRS